MQYDLIVLFGWQGTSTSSPVHPGGVVWDIIIDVLIIVFTYVVVSQVFEANRRIKQLADDPSADVRPLYVPRILRDY